MFKLKFFDKSENGCGSVAAEAAVEWKRYIVLVALPWTRESDAPVPLGHASLLAALRRENGFDSCQIVSPVNDDAFTAQGVLQQVMVEVAGMPCESIDVAIGVYVWNDKYVKGILRGLRSGGFRGRIVLGGPQITYAGDGLEQIYPEADAFVRGQAEAALCALARTGGRPRIRGVHYAGEVDLVEQAETRLQELPSPWLTDVAEVNDKFSVRWETQRGCSFRCSFCQHRQPDARTPVAMQAAQRIEHEIDLFCQAGVKRISVLDPVFNMKPAHASRVLSHFGARGYRGELSLQCRAEMVDDAFLDAAQKLNVCLEFGLQSIHKREYVAVGRPNNMPKVEHVLREVKRRGINHEVSLIYGLPEQTLESFRKTVDWCLSMGIPVIKAFPLLLLRGTELERTRVRWSLVVKEGDLPMVTSSNSFTTADWEEMERIANALASSEGSHPANLDDLMRTPSAHVVSENASKLRALGRA